MRSAGRGGNQPGDVEEKLNCIAEELWRDSCLPRMPALWPPRERGRETEAAGLGKITNVYFLIMEEKCEYSPVYFRKGNCDFFFIFAAGAQK